MDSMSVWEQVLLGVLVLLVLFWFGPGLKVAFKERRSASQEEWLSVLIPIGLVALFVILLVVLM